MSDDHIFDWAWRLVRPFALAAPGAGIMILWAVWQEYPGRPPVDGETALALVVAFVAFFVCSFVAAGVALREYPLWPFRRSWLKWRAYRVLRKRQREEEWAREALREQEWRDIIAGPAERPESGRLRMCEEDGDE